MPWYSFTPSDQANSAPPLTAAPHSQQADPQATVTITNPSGAAPLGEAAEYATLEWNDPWDMNSWLDLRQLDSPACVYANHFTQASPCPDGIWCGRVRSNVSNPDLFILHPSYPNLLHSGRTGQIHPINANVYKQITFRMYIDSVPGGDIGMQVLWTNGTVADIGGSASKYGSSHFYRTYSGWHIYTIDLSAEASILGNLQWGGNITGLRLDPGFSGMNNKYVYIDWIRLTAAQSQPLNWTSTTSGATTILLKEGGNTDDLLIFKYNNEGGTLLPKPPTSAVGANSYSIPASLPPGDWSVQLQVGATSSNVAGPWQVQAAPTLNFVQPGFASGQDYAVAELGDPWDMSNSGDVFGYGNLTGAPQYSNGILTATSADTNPDNDCSAYWENPYLNLLDDVYWEPSGTDPPISTSLYRFVSLRIKVQGTPDISYGWVVRIIWSDFLFGNCGATGGIALHEGWNDINIDLWGNVVNNDADPCDSPWKNSALRRQLRIDPHEIPVQATFQIDDVKLTASDTARRNTVFPVKYVPNKPGASITFYYDTDTNLTNGRTVAQQAGPGPAAGGPYKIFLPLLSGPGNTSPDPPGTLQFDWDLTGVSAGTYYLSARLDDGYNVTNWYSDTPVVVTP